MYSKYIHNNHILNECDYNLINKKIEEENKKEDKDIVKIAKLKESKMMKMVFSENLFFSNYNHYITPW